MPSSKSAPPAAFADLVSGSSILPAAEYKSFQSSLGLLCPHTEAHHRNSHQLYLQHRYSSGISPLPLLPQSHATITHHQRCHRGSTGLFSTEQQDPSFPSCFLKRQASSIYWFSLQMPTMVGGGPAQSWEPGTHSGFPTRVAGTQSLYPSSAASQALRQQESEIKSQSWELNSGHSDVGLGASATRSKTCPSFGVLFSYCLDLFI